MVVYPSAFGQGTALRYQVDFSGYKEDVIMESETGTGEVVTKTTFDIGAYWAILPTDDGRYILMAYPVAGKSNGNITRVLSATTNGTNYDAWTQAIYIDDSNYLDEWDLALIKAYRYVGYEAQEKTNWCWAACSKMFLSSYGIVSCSQSDIVNYTTGSTADEPKDFSYMKRAVEYFGSSENLSVKKHEYKVFSENVLCSILRDDPEEENDVNHIVIIGRTWYPNLNDSSTRVCF